MSKKDGGSPEKKKGGVRLSKKAIQEIIRGDSRELIDELLMLAKMPVDPKTISTKISAIRIALSKVVPDLKAQEIEGEIKLMGPIIYKPSTFNENMEALPKAGDSS